MDVFAQTMAQLESEIAKTPKTTHIRFGITERGDIAFHDGWIDQVRRGDVQAAVLISKGMPTPEGRKAMLEMSDKLVFHATTTGYGRTILEPGVEPFKTRLDKVRAFCDEGFPESHVVIRIDPMIPTRKGITLAESVIRYAYSLGFRRFRYSWMDIYGHVRTRFQQTGLPVPPSIREADKALVKSFVDGFCRKAEAKGCTFESCAEYNRHQAGCISKRDFELCGLDPDLATGKSSQRSACMCCGAKTELLDHKGRCGHRCLYCYWR